MSYGIHRCAKCGWEAYCDGEVPTHVCHKQERERPVMETKLIHANISAEDSADMDALRDAAYHTKPADEYQVGGSHYKDMPVQPWTVMESLLTRDEFIGYLKGCCIKYAMRVGKKDEHDGGKLRHYMQKLDEIERKKFPDGW